MILQALYRLAQDENLMADPDYECKPVAWLVRVGKGGKLLGIEGTHEVCPDERVRKNPKSRPRRFKVPRQSPKRAGTKAPAEFFVDNALYVFGQDLREDPFSQEDIRLRASWFREKVRKCVVETGDEGALAVLALLDAVADGKQNVALPEKCVSNELFAFIYAADVDRLVTDREKVREYWMRLRREGQGEATSVQCLVSGRPCIWSREVAPRAGAWIETASAGA